MKDNGETMTIYLFDKFWQKGFNRRHIKLSADLIVQDWRNASVCGMRFAGIIPDVYPAGDTDRAQPWADGIMLVRAEAHFLNTRSDTTMVQYFWMEAEEVDRLMSLTRAYWVAEETKWARMRDDTETEENALSGAHSDARAVLE